MPYLNLYLSGDAQPELLRTEFLADAHSAPLRSVRGKTARLYGDSVGTFQWTAAVQGLTVLCLRTLAQQSESGKSSELDVLEGEGNTLASALDYALGKPPIWLIELFGSDVQGEALAKRLFIRSNPERKQPGPVRIRVNQRLLPAREIRIFRGETQVSSAPLLLELAEAIERRSGLPRLSASAQLPGASNTPSWLAPEFVEAGLSSMQSVDIFSSAGMKRIVERLGTYNLHRRAGAAEKLAEAVLSPRDSQERFGLGEYSAAAVRRHFDDRELRVSLPVGTSACYELFLYLQHHHGYPFEIDFNYQHAIEIRRKMQRKAIREQQDLIVLGVAPALTMLSQKGCEYRPLMFFPAFSQRALAKRSAAAKGGGSGFKRFMFTNSEPSTSTCYFDDLCRTKQVSKAKSSVEHGDPGDIFDAFRGEVDETFRAIAFFPHYTFNCRFNDCVLVDDVKAASPMKDSVLCAHSSFFADRRRARLLCGALRDAWLTLMQNGEVRGRLVREQLLTPGYLQSLSRIAGLRRYELLS